MLASRRVLVVSLAAFACSSNDVAAPAPSGVLAAPVVASDVADVFRLGDEVIVSHAELGVPARLERVLADGRVAPLVVADMPTPVRTPSRGVQEVTSGAPTALVGRPGGPTWMAWSTYSTFGSTVLMRVDGARAVADDDWAPVLTVEHRYEVPEPEDVAPGIEPEVVIDRTSIGEARGGGRGRLLGLTNMVSGETTGWIALPEIAARDDARSVVAHAVDLGRTGSASELADGTIVHVGEDAVTCLRRGARTSRALPPEIAAVLAGALVVRPRACDELLALAAPGELVRISGDRLVRTRIPTSVVDLAVADDGTPWLTTTGPEAFREEGGAWRAVRWSGGGQHDRVVAVTREAVFVRRDERLLLRVAVP